MVGLNNKKGQSHTSTNQKKKKQKKEYFEEENITRYENDNAKSSKLDACIN